MPSAVLADVGPRAGGIVRPPWWTEADQGELDVLLEELVAGVLEHRERCARCAEGFPPCPHVGRAITVVLDWRRARELRSYARWVRLQRDLLELREDSLVHRLRGRS